MRILITNDDGINAPGLKVLYSIANQITDAENIITVAPAFEQSGVGHCISYLKELKLQEIKHNKFTVEGSPADCVIVGVLEIMKNQKPDLILSGVNKGNNAAQNTLYSGTIGATIEASMQGIRSIALSQFYSSKNTLSDMFSSAKEFGAPSVQKILTAGHWGNNDNPLFYNVNFPPIEANDVKGYKITHQGFRQTIPFLTQKNVDGKLFLTAGDQEINAENNSDVAANLTGYVSITPCKIDLTAHDQINSLKAAFA